MKKLLALLLFLIVSLTACAAPQTEEDSSSSSIAENSGTEGEIPVVTPLLIPTCGDESVTPFVCSTDWNDQYADRDIHPLEWQSVAPALVLGAPSATVTLSTRFIEPISLRVSGWENPSWGEYDAVPTEVPVTNGEFTLQINWTYQIEATWEVEPGTFKSALTVFRTIETDPGDYPPALILRYEDTVLYPSCYTFFWGGGQACGSGPVTASDAPEQTLTITEASYDVLFDFDKLTPASVQVSALPISEADNPDAEWTNVNDFFRVSNPRIFRAQAGYIYQVDVIWADNWAMSLGTASYAFRVVEADGE